MGNASEEPKRPGASQSGFGDRVVAWQRKHGRHDLPWQNTRDAYRVWLSEIMLQQTQVSTALPYYERFVAAFPDVRALAAAVRSSGTSARVSSRWMSASNCSARRAWK